MEQQQLSALRQALEAQQQELIERLEGISKEIRHEDAPVEADSEERVSATENDEVLDALGVSGQQELREIKAALGRMDAGQYGICTACGQPIALARLQALPYAALCIACSE